MSVTVPQGVVPEVYTFGSMVQLTADLSDLAGTLEEASAVHWLVRDPSGVETDRSADVANPSTGVYTLAVSGDAPGDWHWRVVTEGLVVAADGWFRVVDDYAIIGDPRNPVDLHVLVPRARRYCEGPYGPPQGKSPLLDSQLYEMSADACADIILLTGSLFGHQLLVTGRDSRVGFPTAWATEVVLEEWEAALVTTQTALNYWFFTFRDLRTTLSIKNEGTEYGYTLSANVMRDYIAQLRAARDAAIAGLKLHHPVMDRFASNIRVRDQATVAVLEWWDTNSTDRGGGMPGGQEAAVIPWTPGWSGDGFRMA